jgi:DNA transposition AAA+ family ATPase
MAPQELITMITKTPEFEDTLPNGQKTIRTLGVERFERNMKLIRSAKEQTGYSMMVAIVGRAGSGKTIAVQSYVDGFEIQSHTGLRPVIKVKVDPRSTARALTTNILLALNEQPRGRNQQELAQQGAHVLVANDIQILIVDEADWLTADSFDLLRRIHDNSGCPVVLVGLPSLLSVIRTHEKFISRVGMVVRFPVSTKDEWIKTILPNLVFPHWQYDLSNAQDRALGEWIFQIVGPSLRRLRHLVTLASCVADHDGIERITKNEIEEVRSFTPDAPGSDADDTEQEMGEYERISMARREAKKKRGGKSQIKGQDESESI